MLEGCISTSSGVLRREALTTKLRVVFAESSKPSNDSPSLNEYL